MIAYLLLILLVAILAYFDARREKRMIDARPGGPDLDHKELIWRRLRNVGVLVMVAVVCDGTDGWDALWMGLCHAGAAWATFTITHRLSLNLMRGFDWGYVSDGNAYDRFWINLCTPSEWTPKKGQHHFNYGVFRAYDKAIHRAGARAYCFETAVLAASIVGAIATLTNT